jgi:uncharacterized membrane protein YtjA (UPF0391 family)
MTMLRAAIVFFVIGLVAFALGAGNLAGMSTSVGKLLPEVFVVLAVLSLLASLITGRAPRLP